MWHDMFHSEFAELICMPLNTKVALPQHAGPRPQDSLTHQCLRSIVLHIHSGS